MRKILGLLVLVLLYAAPAFGQGSVLGQETTISYSGTNAQLTNPGTPLTNLASGTGTNTFILPIANPTVAVRVYVTNNTANACASPLTIQMFSSTDASVTSFNNALSNWQTVLLQSPGANGTLVSSVSLSLPASAAIYITSTAIVSPKVAIQVVSTAGQCASTTVEVTAVVTQVAVGSPLVSTLNATPNFAANQVQGVIPAGGAANLVNPIVVSGQGPAVNGGFTTSGLDTLSPLAETTGLVQTSAIPIFNGTAPVPTQKTNEIAIGIFSGVGATCGLLQLSSPWSMIQGTSIPGGANFGAALIYPASGGQNLVVTNNNAGSCTWTSGSSFHAILNFISTGPTGGVNLPLFQQIAGPNTIVAASNPAGSTLLTVTVSQVPNTNCVVTGVTDTLGNSFAQIGTILDGTVTGTNNINGMSIWSTTNKNPGGGDTVTIATSGTCNATNLYMDIPGTGIATLVQPSIPIEVDSQGAEVVRQDALGANDVTCSVTLSTNTTTQLANCPANPTINGAAGRYYITDIQINTTTAGTATTLQLKAGTGVNCAGTPVNLSNILYANTTVGLQNILSYRTPLVAPTTDEICATQAGTTAGTSVVEVHAFIAP